MKVNFMQNFKSRLTALFLISVLLLAFHKNFGSINSLDNTFYEGYEKEESWTNEIIQNIDLSIKKEIIGSRPFIVRSDMTINFRVTVKNEGGIPADNIKLVDYMPSLGSVINTQGWVNNLNGTASLILSVDNDSIPSGGLVAGDSIVLEYSMLIDADAMRPIVYNFIEIASVSGSEGEEVEDQDSTPDEVFGNDEQIETEDDEDPIFTEDDISGVVFFNCKSLKCNAQVNVSLDANCEALIDPSFLNSAYKDLPYRLELHDERGRLIPGNLLTEEHIGQKIKASVINIDVCSSNSCWGFLTVEDKLPPVLTAPEDTTVYCLNGLTPDRTGDATAEDCSDVKIGYRDIQVIKKNKCEREGDTLQVITRLWTAMDIRGMMVSDTQVITVLSLPDILVRVPTTTLLLNCGESTHPDSIMKYLGTKDAYPHFINPSTGDTVKIGIGESCNLAASYTDGARSYQCGPYCGGTYKMIRTWTLLNWCTGRSRTMHQIIKVEDKTPPVVEVTEPTIIFNVNAWKCGMDLDLPVGVAIDECDASPRVVKIEAPIGIRIERIGNRWRAFDVPKGETVFRYIATDCCGNTGETEITIRVEDRVAPVPVAKEFITLSLTASNDSSVTGVAKLKVENIDNGSYDNCSPIYMEIRREDGAPACLNFGELWNHDDNDSTLMVPWNNNITYNARSNGRLQQVPLHLQDNSGDTDLGQVVKFCCEDIGKDVKVYLRVWDDGDMDGVFGSSGDNYNETWTMVKVEDKSLPHLTCKPIIITTCTSDSSRVYPGKGWQDVEERVVTGLWPRISSVCANGLGLEFRDEGTVTQCNTTLPQQVIRRTYRVKGTDVTCLQEITLLDIQRNPALDYPIEIMKWNKCILTEQDVLANTWRATSESSINDKGYGKVVARNSAGQPLIFRPDFRNTGCAVYGRQIKIEEYETNEGCKKWVVRFNYINWCNIEEKSYREVTYKFEDKTPPQITGIEERDTVDVDAVSCVGSWSAMPAGIDPDNECEGGLAWKVILTKGTFRSEQTGQGSKPSIRFANLEPGIYKVTYRLQDACANVNIKEQELWVRGKKPTPYCISLSSALMKDGTVELWARDFDKGSFGNCGNKVLYYTFDQSHPVLSKLHRAHYFKGRGEEVTGSDTTTLYRAGEIQRWVPDITVRQRPTLPGGEPDPRGADTTVTGGSSARLFGCKVGNGSTFPRAEIKMTAWDEHLNNDFCTVELFLVDNMGDCSGSSLVSIGGTISTINTETVSNVDVELKANLPEYPVKTKTDNKGKYQFNGLPLGARYEINPVKTNDYLNGVNTLDLVRIQRHILGIKKLDNPYLLIAADADGDQAVKVNDIVELRKIILGISERLPNSESWKMVRNDKKMGATPWPFDEVILHGVLTENSIGNDFTAVKVGDVDGSASANGLSQQTEPRNTGVVLSAEDKIIKAGEEAEVIIRADEFRDVYGMQFTMEHKGLEMVSADGIVIDLGKDNIGKPKEGVITVSLSGNQGITADKGTSIISIRFKALETVQLSKVLKLSSQVTLKEAYTGQKIERVGIILEIRSTEKPADLNLTQNQPNPWKGSTIIRYDLPKSQEVTLRVIDMSGKIIMNKKLKGLSGVNQYTLERSDIGSASGILFYSLEVSDQILQKSMIVIE